MAADPDGTGVWFFAQGGTSAHPLDTVFYWSGSTGRLGRYQLHAANPGLQGGAQTPIAVDAAGTAWIGDNKTLISVNRKTGAISSLALPNVSLAGANAPGLPSPPSVKFAQDFTDIDAVAIAPDGSVIVARQYATELQEIDPASRTFSSLPLPKHTELASLGADVAGQGRGEIAAALYAGGGVHELGQYSRGAWHVTQRPCAAYAVAMTATAIAVTGPACVATGSVPRSGRVATLASQPASAAAGSGDQACAIPLPAGLLAMCSRAGVEMAPAGTTPGLTLSLGKIIGAPPVQPDGQPAGNAKSGLVAWTITPGLMAPAANGALWFVPAQGGTMIGLVSRGAAS